MNRSVMIVAGGTGGHVYPGIAVAQCLREHGVELHHLCTWWDVLAEARASQAFDAQTLNEVQAFLNDPRAWQEARK